MMNRMALIRATTKAFCCLFAVVALTTISTDAYAEPKPPPGYETRCHNKTFGSGLHCHVVPEGARADFEPFSISAMALQLVGGVIIGGSLALGAGYGTYLLLEGPGGLDENSATVYGFLAAVPGGLFGTTFGIFGIGELMGGDGSFWITFLGSVVFGSLGGVAAYHLSTDVTYENEIDSFDRLPGPVRYQKAGISVGVPIVSVRF